MCEPDFPAQRPARPRPSLTYVRFYACEDDFSHDSPDEPLPAAVATGREPLLVADAMSGGQEGGGFASNKGGMRRLAVVLAAATSVVLGGLPVGAEPAGAIAGVVTDNAGAVADELCVHAYPKRVPEFGTPVPIGSAKSVRTAADGTYRIEGLDPGIYTVEFAECFVYGGWSGGYYLHDRYYRQWYSGDDTEEAADPVIVALDEVRADAVMIRKTAISGRVMDASGEPVPWLCMNVVRNRYEWSTTYSQPDGSWSFKPGEDGIYWVGFSTCPPDPETHVWRPQWWNGKAYGDAPTPIEFRRGVEVFGVDARMVRTGSISGQIGGYPWVCVQVYDAERTLVASVEGHPDGYVVGGLETGDYRVLFRDCHVAGVADQWYSDAETFEEATPVHVEFGSDTGGIDVTLRDAGTITGRVTDSDGNPVGVCVTAWDPAGYPYVGTATREDGTYVLPWMQPRGVKVSFDDCRDNAYEWWDDEGSFETAGVVPVESGGTTRGIDAVIDGVPPREYAAMAGPRRIPLPDEEATATGAAPRFVAPTRTSR